MLIKINCQYCNVMFEYVQMLYGMICFFCLEKVLYVFVGMEIIAKNIVRMNQLVTMASFY